MVRKKCLNFDKNIKYNNHQELKNDTPLFHHVSAPFFFFPTLQKYDVCKFTKISLPKLPTFKLLIAKNHCCVVILKEIHGQLEMPQL